MNDNNYIIGEHTIITPSREAYFKVVVYEYQQSKGNEWYKVLSLANGKYSNENYYTPKRVLNALSDWKKEASSTDGIGVRDLGKFLPDFLTMERRLPIFEM